MARLRFNWIRDLHLFEGYKTWMYVDFWMYLFIQQLLIDENKKRLYNFKDVVLFSISLFYIELLLIQCKMHNKLMFYI